MKKIAPLLVFALLVGQLFGQKMLLLEDARSAKTQKMYLGHVLKLKIAGQPGWVERELTDVLPEQNALKLDGFVMPISEIEAIKIPKRGIVRLLGNSLFALGATSTFAATVGLVFYQDTSVLPWYGVAAGSFLLSRPLLKPRKLKLGERRRLRPLEIKFEPPIIKKDEPKSED